MVAWLPALLRCWFVATLCLVPTAAFACTHEVSICARSSPTSLRLIADGHAAPVVVDAAAGVTVRRAADALARDLAAIGGTAAQESGTDPVPGRAMILIGVLGQSPLIDRLIADKRISIDGLAGQWEGFRQIVVDDPYPGVSRALVVVGADRRGAVFGTYDISEKAGVSPWSWWADVPVRHRRNLYLTARARADAPKVKYRGIFINDEEPAFGTWAKDKFGGVNAKAYAHVFDLILRLKGNYLWPAMWGKSIAADDPRSMALADELGVVLGTSHHEPMTRAQAEWHRDTDGGVTGGRWDYTTNAANLRTFWRGGIERMMTRTRSAGGASQGFEQLVTLGMRGDGDEPMAEGTAISLLETIVADQRRIIADVTGRPLAATPQVWALYKEVQDYHDRGMKVPEDVTLLFSDDNWGQIRRLPADVVTRAGGYGVYYHFDYVGGPRNYKWLNTNQIEKVWQQMDLAYARGARQIWIANVGDIKPMEMPIDFFLKMAWNPEAMTPQALFGYPRRWASATFGEALGGDIGEIVSDYSRLAARRKPELVDADSFALGKVARDTLNGGEFGAILAEWEGLMRRMEAVRARLSPDQRDAYLQLVEHPVAAMSNLYGLYYAVAWNKRLAALGDRRANLFADRVEAAFARDRGLTDAFHRAAGGKWNGMMLQTKFGYTSWRDPPVDVMPPVRRLGGSGPSTPIRFRPSPPDAERTAVAVEAVDYARKTAGADVTWQAIPRLGRTAGAVGSFPQGRPATRVADGVRIDYDLDLPQAGEATVRVYAVPTLDTRGADGLRLGVSIDDGPVQILTMNLKVDAPNWTQAVRDNAFPLEVRVGTIRSGRHRVTLWRLDDNVLVQKIILYTGKSEASYLGPRPAR